MRCQADWTVRISRNRSLFELSDTLTCTRWLPGSERAPHFKAQTTSLAALRLYTPPVYLDRPLYKVRRMCTSARASSTRIGSRSSLLAHPIFCTYRRVNSSLHPTCGGESTKPNKGSKTPCSLHFSDECPNLLVTAIHLGEHNTHVLKPLQKSKELRL